uniref:Uncharacterized protein n=1 Tax=Buteo japonicus TaxID=224669 RepID=A0A8C0BP64_9AVES
QLIPCIRVPQRVSPNACGGERLNAELEAKTEKLVRQAEEVIQQQNNFFFPFLSLNTAEDQIFLGHLIYHMALPDCTDIRLTA